MTAAFFAQIRYFELFSVDKLIVLLYNKCVINISSVCAEAKMYGTVGSAQLIARLPAFQGDAVS